MFDMQNHCGYNDGYMLTITYDRKNEWFVLRGNILRTEQGISRTVSVIDQDGASKTFPSLTSVLKWIEEAE